MNPTTLLLHGDCLELLPCITDASVALVLTDPPYGTTACKWDSVIPFEPMWKQVWRVLKPNGAAVFTASQPFTSALVMSQAKHFKYDWSWTKTTPSGHLNAKKMPLRSHEDILVFALGKTRYLPQKTQGHPRKVAKNVDRSQKLSACYGSQKSITNYDSTERYPRSSFTTSTDRQKVRLHPTQKPVALMEYLIRTYTNEGETVLDFTMGSGTTGVACMNTGRNFIGIERDEKYFQIAIERIEKAKSSTFPCLPS